jgi:hypothetical protein
VNLTPLWSSLWQFDPGRTIDDPGVRHYRWSDIYGSSTGPSQLAISTTDDDNLDRQELLMELQPNHLVMIRSTTTSEDWMLFSITADPVDLTTWVLLDVLLGEAGASTQQPSGNNRMLFDFVTTATAEGQITANDVFAWMGTPAPSDAALDSMAGVVDAVYSNLAKTHTAPDPADADYTLAVTMQCARLWKRKSSPEGVIANSEFGAIRVTRFDSDIERMLDPFATFVVG